MTDRAWKQFERRLARRLGTRRIPVTGERARADFEDGLFVYQAKKGRHFPAYLAEWLCSIRAAGERRGGKIGVVVWQAHGRRDAEAVVVLRFADWRDLHVGRPDPLAFDPARMLAGEASAEEGRTRPLAEVLSELRARHSSATSAGAPQKSVGKALQAAICARPECGRPFTPSRRGSPQKYCGPRCRWLTWRAAHPQRDAREVA